MLGRAGVVSMVATWSLAVGYAFLPWRLGRSPLYALVALSFPIVLVAATPHLIFVAAMTALATGVVMGPSNFLVSADHAVNRKRAAMFLLAAAASLFLLPLTPEWLQWVSIPLTPLAGFGAPIGLLLLTAGLFRRRPVAAIFASAVLFLVSWCIWMLRDHFYRLP